MDSHAFTGASARAAKLRLGVTLGYASGQFFEGIINTSLSIFLLFYVTAVCGLPGGLAGAALSIGILVDAIMDPLIGTVSDSWHSRLGRRLPFMLAGLLPASVCFVLIFALPAGLGHLALFAWLAALCITLRISMSLFILPYQAVGAELSDDYDERSSIMAWRWGIGMVGALLSVVLGFGVFLAGHDGLSRRAAYWKLALTLAAIVLAAAMMAIRTIHRSRARLHAPSANSGGGRLRLLAELLELYKNRSFRILFAGALLFFVAQGVSTSLALHANTFFWHLTASQTQCVTLGLFVGLLVGAPLAGVLAARFEKRTILLAGMIGLLLAQGGPVVLRLWGFLSFTGTALAWLLASVMFTGGVLLAAAAIAFSSMMADAADEHEHLFGERREALFFAGWAFASKAALGAGAFIAGMVLQLIHFPTNLTGQGGTAAILPAAMVDTIAIFYGPGASMIFLISALTCLFYRLDKKTHASIMLTLAARRASASALSLMP